MSKSARALKAEFTALLSKEHSEQTYQSFMEKNTRLVPREFVQNHGIHFSLLLRKLAFGADYKTDFFYLSKSSADWHCVFIEIEKPQSRYFREKTNKFHPDFQAALEQISSWRAWLSNDGNRAAFTHDTLSLIRTPLGENPCHMKFVLVFGRRAEFENSKTRRNLINAQERDDFKIMSFDSLCEDIERKHDLFVVARKNDYIDILSDEVVDAMPFAWMEPSQIRVSKALSKNMAAGNPGGIKHLRSDGNGNHVEALKFMASRVRIRP